jgi:hypothetical protein
MKKTSPTLAGDRTPSHVRRPAGTQGHARLQQARRARRYSPTAERRAGIHAGRGTADFTPLDVGGGVGVLQRGKFSPGAGPTLTGGSCCSAYFRAKISDVPLDWAKTVFSTVE